MMTASRSSSMVSSIGTSGNNPLAGKQAGALNKSLIKERALKCKQITEIQALRVLTQHDLLTLELLCAS